MRRRLNLKYLLGLVLVVAVLGGGVHLLHGVQVKRAARGLLRRADVAEKAGDRDGVKKYLELYLGSRPNDAQVVARYGLLLAKDARSPEGKRRAFLTLEQAMRLDPGRTDLRRPLAQVAMDPALQRYTEAREQLRRLLGRDTPEAVEGRADRPGDAALEALIGRCYEGEKKYDDAVRWYGVAVVHDPADVDSAVRRAALLRGKLERPDEADQAMDAMVRANGRSVRAFLARGSYRAQAGLKGADDDIARALELAPDDPDAIAAAAGAAVDRGDVAEARRLAGRLKALRPKDPRAFDLLAQAERRADRPEAAEAALRQGVEAVGTGEDRLRLLWSLAVLLLDEGQGGRARKVLDGLEKEKMRPELTQFLEARLLVVDGRWEQASRALEAVHPLLVDRPDLAYQADLLLGRCYDRLGKADLKLEAYRRAVAAFPLQAAGLLGLAEALTALGKLDEAIPTYERAVDAAGPSADFVPGVRVLVARLRLVQALRRPAGSRDWSAFDRALDEATRGRPDAPEPVILRVQGLMARDRRDEARALLESERDRHPKEVVYRTALAQLAESGDDPKAALAVLDRARADLGDRVELRLARAAYWVRRGGAGAVKELAPLEGKLDGLSEADRERLLRGLVDAHLRLDDRAGAAALLDRLIEAKPADMGLRVTRFDLALVDGDEAALERALEGLRAADTADGTTWRFTQVRYLIWRAGRGKDKGGPDPKATAEARRLLAEINERRPNWAATAAAEADLSDLAGRPDETLTHCLRAIELGMRSPSVVRRAVQLLRASRRFEEMDALLQKVQEAGTVSDDPLLLQAAAESSLRRNDKTQAVELARKTDAATSKDYRDHLWLGGVLAAAGDANGAEEQLRQAANLGGDAPEPWLALIRFQAGAGRRKDAEATLDGARKRLEKSPGVLAAALAAVGRAEEARAAYDKALAASPDDPALLEGAAGLDLGAGRTKVAEERLRRLVALGAKAPEGAAWGRRMLSLILATGRLPERTREAFRLAGLPDDVAAYQPAADEPVDNLRLKAQVLAFQGRPASRRAAIRILERLTGVARPATEDLFLLAQLDERQKDWAKARDLLARLVATGGEQPRYLGRLAGVLLKADDVDGASPWIGRLERVDPKSPVTIELKARLLHARKRDAEAVALLKGFAGDDAGKTRAVATLLEELGQDDAAGELLRQLAAKSKSPEGLADLALFLARHGRLDEALDLCEKAWPAGPPETVAGITVAALYVADRGERQAERAARPIEAALARRPDSVDLLFQLGNIRGLQGQHDEAEALYRRAMKLGRDDEGPANNLAWLLAMTGGEARQAEALGLIQGVIDRQGPLPDLLDTRAAVYLAQGRADLAIADLEEAVDAAPSPDKQYHLAQAYRRADRRADAGRVLGEAEAAGLRIDRLHPLDRAGYRKLRDEVAQK